MERTWWLLRKELTELRRSRWLLLSMAALPLTMLPVPIVLVELMVRSSHAEAADLAQFYRVSGLLGPDPRLGLIHLVIQHCAGLFLVMPLFIPVLIAAQSVAGEKERRTIEPLLASPLTASEIVLAKSLGAVLPALGITWVAFALFALGVDVAAHPLTGKAVLPDLSWLFTVLVLVPLLCFLSNTVTVLVSSRVNDSRVAQQLSALLVIPFLGLVVLQFAGLVFLGPLFDLLLASGVALVDVLLFALAVRLFDRERILSRWG
jgi:ABC-2 type transport system permease protein